MNMYDEHVFAMRDFRELCATTSSMVSISQCPKQSKRPSTSVISAMSIVHDRQMPDRLIEGLEKLHTYSPYNKPNDNCDVLAL